MKTSSSILSKQIVASLKQLLLVMKCQLCVKKQVRPLINLHSRSSYFKYKGNELQRGNWFPRHSQEAEEIPYPESGKDMLEDECLTMKHPISSGRMETISVNVTKPHIQPTSQGSTLLLIVAINLDILFTDSSRLTIFD